MQKTGRFYALTKYLVILIVTFFVLGILRDILQDYLKDFEMYLRYVYVLIAFVRTISVLAMIAIGLYFAYQGFIYISSSFYRKTKIPVHEAFYHGYFDLAYVYERLHKLGEVTYDTKTRSVIVKNNNDVNYIIVRDIFGRLQGQAKDDTWYIVSKKKKEYGNIRYMKRKPLRNPLYENRDLMNKLEKSSDLTYHNYVCLTGLRRNTYNNPQINTVYELETILSNQRKGI